MSETAILEKVNWQEQAHRVANGIRMRVLEHTLKNNGGYLSQACSSAEIFATLYTKVLNLGPSQAPMIPLPFNSTPGANNPHPIRGAAYNGAISPEYDRFFVSPGHYALVVYASLIEVGRLDENGLAEFNKDGSTVEMIGADHSPGFEVMAGSLAQAISVAGGVAQARKIKREPGRTFIFMTDGEMEEGQVWEAVAALSYYKLGNVFVYIDINGQQCDGPTSMVMNVELLKQRLEAFGAIAVEVNGHDVDALAAPVNQLGGEKPVFVLAHTNPCEGLPLLESRRPFVHYIRFKTEEERASYQSFYEELVRAKES